MIVKEHPCFSEWFANLKDPTTKFKITSRIGRVSCGLLGDSHSVGDGVSELRLHFGSGYRLYYTIRNRQIIILLIGGDKSSQCKDIAKAKRLAKEIL